VLNGQNILILSGFDSCHTHPMLVIPIGVEATIDFNTGSFYLNSKWVEANQVGPYAT
jgi:muramoyltetrapeptide carboxypeptidase